MMLKEYGALVVIAQIFAVPAASAGPIGYVVDTAQYLINDPNPGCTLSMTFEAGYTTDAYADYLYNGVPYNPIEFTDEAVAYTTYAAGAPLEFVDCVV